MCIFLIYCLDTDVPRVTRSRTKLRNAETRSGFGTVAGPLVMPAIPGPVSKSKRPRDDDTSAANKKVKCSHIHIASTSGAAAPTTTLSLDGESEATLAEAIPNRLRKVQLQMAGYALEMLSSALLRSHTIGMLMDTQDIQMAYYDHSCILLSAPFSIDTDELYFLETIYHLRALSPQGRGIVSRPDYVGVNPGEHDPPDQRREIMFYADAASEVNFGSQRLILGEILHRARSIVGRGTIVIDHEAAPEGRYKDMLYSIKFSFSPAARHSEASLIWYVTRTSKQDPGWSWVQESPSELRS
ncbi:hypothetical protein K435DRAFT_461914 [Dendrothele bispora CBS 962.96]|uniref:Fungal-type protein kinase domain-containing protein n=1 Tax=Dendrothele bispora (strain CBS 962.96) TaxID=1314807 RepID=A0A4S8MCM7_DENBC|nr:hypothetical protein K435DRAFT_461914 [Dendrothele bispora CBS 962.96]